MACFYTAHFEAIEIEVALTATLIAKFVGHFDDVYDLLGVQRTTVEYGIGRSRRYVLLYTCMSRVTLTR